MAKQLKSAAELLKAIPYFIFVIFPSTSFAPSADVVKVVVA
jgi:hypothetical protein